MSKKEKQLLLADIVRLGKKGHNDVQIAGILGITVQEVRKLKRENEDYISQFEKELEDAGFNPHDWKHGWLKTKTSSIFIKNPQGIVDPELLVEDMIKKIQEYSPEYPYIVREINPDPHLLIIDPADIHIGKLAELEETGGEYNIEIAKRKVLEGVRGILKKAQGFHIEMITLVIGNDILHTDTPFRKTTAGTPQDTDGQWHRAFNEALDLYVQIVELLYSVADLKIIFNPSNHDFMSGFMLSRTLEAWFRKNRRIVFDTRIIHRKYFQYGQNLIGTSHGDGAKESDVPILVAQEVPELWATTKYRYVYLHHVHHKKKIALQTTKDYIGLTIEYLRSPSGTDGWHHRNGYVGVPKAVEGFIHHPEHGQIARITHHV